MSYIVAHYSHFLLFIFLHACYVSFSFMHGTIWKVHENWKNRWQTTPKHKSLEADSLEVKTCIEMALQCVEPDRARRPTIMEVVDKLNELETLKLSLIDQV